VICPSCRAELGPEARFCPECGKAIAMTEGSGSMPQATEPDLAGRVIGNNFRIIAKLGEGGMGAVYRGEQISLRRPIAIKLLKPDLSANQMLVRRFNAEAEAVAKLHHPNTVNIIEFGQDQDGTLFIAMELIEGRSLRSVVHREAPLSPQRTLAIAMQIAESLSDAHAHDLVHRDLKPDNVMLQNRGRLRDFVRVLDFGIAKLRDDSRPTMAAMTQAGDMLGTPQYMAPEQIKGEAVDGRVDVYALGCIIYELVTARQPFEATTVMQMLSKHLLEAPIAPSVRRPDLAIPPEIDRLVLTAMMKDPRARPQTMDAYGEAIAQARAALPAESTPRPTPRPAVTPPQGQGPATAYTPPPGGMPDAMQQPTPQVMSPMPSPTPTAPVPSPQPYAAPPQYPPTMQVARKTGGGSKLALWIVGGLAVVGGAIGIGLALRGGGPSGHTDVTKIDPAPAPAPDPADPWSASPGPSPSLVTPHPTPDQPEHPFQVPAPPPLPAPTPGPAPAPRKSGDKLVEIQGVQLHLSSDFSYAWNNGAMVATSPSRGAMIMAFPVTSASNDGGELAKEYAQSTGFTLDGVSTATVSGTTRPIAAYHGMVNGQPFAQAVVALLGPSYRVGVSITVPLAKAKDAQLLSWGDDFFAHRITLP
jgi:serine/threonine-protein kinase